MAMDGCDFRGADLQGTNFSNSSLSDARFDYSDVSEVKFANALLLKIDFSCLELHRIVFDGSKLLACIFDEAEISYASFKDSLISHVSLTNAFVFCSDFRIANRDDVEGIELELGRTIGIRAGEGATIIPDVLSYPDVWLDLSELAPEFDALETYKFELEAWRGKYPIQSL